MLQLNEKKRIVTFWIKPLSQVNRVLVASDFDNWQPVRMKKLKHGFFVVHVEAPSGNFQYKYLVNGRWVQDPGCNHGLWEADMY